MTLPVDPSRYLAFLGVMTAMAFFPGPANLFSVATGIVRGPKAALLGVAGMNCATLVWFAAAGLGLGALVAAFPEAFRLLRLASAAYLLWMALTSVRDGLTPHEVQTPAGRVGRRAAFVEGFAVQIANPKVILFFTAVLPPFLDIVRPLAPQLGLFAVGMIALDVAAMSAYGLGGSAFSQRMQAPGFRRVFAFVVAAMLAAAAVLVARSAIPG